MILDLNKCGWTHEKIADVLRVSGASTVSEGARGGIPNYDNSVQPSFCYGKQRRALCATHW